MKDLYGEYPGESEDVRSRSMGNAAGLLLTTMVLAAFGLNMLYSASGGDMTAAVRLFRNQLLWTIMGGAGGLLAFAFSYKFFCRHALVWLAGCALLLIWARLSKEVNGAHRWIHLGPYTFQPSELAKIAVALFVAEYCSEHLRTFNSLDPRNRCGMWPLLCGVGAMLMLILVGKDLGTTMLVAAVG